MKVPNGRAVLLVSCLVTACTEQPFPRTADQAETKAILSSLMPHGDFAKKYPYCFEPTLAPPLFRARQEAENNRPKGIWGSSRAWVSKLFWLPTSQSSTPPEWIDSKGLRLREGDASRINELLKRAIDASLPSKAASMPLSNGAKPCTGPVSDPKLPMAYTMSRISYSSPVIVDNVAFVESAHVCGYTCGAGGLTALINRNGKWSVIAAEMQWIS